MSPRQCPPRCARRGTKPAVWDAALSEMRRTAGRAADLLNGRPKKWLGRPRLLHLLDFPPTGGSAYPDRARCEKTCMEVFFHARFVFCGVSGGSAVLAVGRVVDVQQLVGAALEQVVVDIA